MSTRPYAHLAEGITLTPPLGGEIRVGGDEVYPAGQLVGTQEGAAFGPLLISVPEGAHLEVERVMFLPPDEDGLLFFSGVGALAGVERGRTPAREDIPEAEQPQTTRRALLGLGLGALAGALAGSKPVAGQTEDETVALEVCEVDISYLDAPLSVTVVDQVAGVLPPETELYIDAAGTRVGKVADVGEEVVLRSLTGTMEVYLRTSKDYLARLLAWVRSLIPGDDSISWKREFPDGKKASDYSEGQFVSLSRHPSIVNPIAESGADATTLTIGNTTIPHGDSDTTGEAGIWDIVSDSLIYEVGSNPPVASGWKIVTRLGPIQQFLE